MALKLSAILFLVATFSAAHASGLEVSEELLTGSWRCGPTVMKGPQFAMSVISETQRLADRTFVSTTTTVLTPSNKPSITVKDISQGTWSVEGTTLVWVYQTTKFVSSSDPALSNGLWQKIQDEQLSKKSVFKSRILELGHDSMRSIPIEPEHPEAAVVASCSRTS